MLFSHKPTAIVFVQQHKLTLYDAESAHSGSLDFPEGTVQYMEVLDVAKFSSAIAEFAAQHHVADEKIIVILDQKLVFQKSLPLTDATTPEAIETAATDFTSKVPFNPEDRQTMSVKQKDDMHFFGANRAFYTLVREAFESAGAKVDAINPGTVYDIPAGDNIGREKLGQIRQASQLTTTTNFLTAEHAEVKG